MSGQQEPGSGLDRPDPRDSTLDLSGLISRLNNGSPSKRNNDRGNGVPDNGASLGNAITGNSGGPDNSGGAGNSAGSGNSRPRGIGDGTSYPRPPTNGHGAAAGHGVKPEPGVDASAVVNAGAGRPERPVPGSLADLRQRLERLPYGHPSSPYHVDGELKPPPPRLKHLELAPPAPSRMTQGQSQPPIHDDDPITAGTPVPPSRTVAPGTLTPPATPGTAPGHTNSVILTEDQERIAHDAYDRFRAAEGRSLFGSYGSSGLTVVLRQIAAGLEYGELAPDTEQNSLLEPDAFKARFAAMLARYPDRSAELLARRIPGAISYSFIFDAERYSAGIWMVQDVLTAADFQLLGRRNDWSSAANRCVATMWHDPTSGLPFEVQFHTTASLEAQQLARTSASLVSDPRIPSAEATNLKSDLAAAWAALPAPPGHGQIADYRRDGGSPPPGSRSIS